MDGWMLRGLIKRKTGTHATFPFLHFTTPRKEFPSDIGVLRSHPLPSAWIWSSTCTHGPSFCGLSFVLWHTSPCSSCFVKHLNDALITKSTKAWRFEIWNECNVIRLIESMRGAEAVAIAAATLWCHGRPKKNRNEEVLIRSNCNKRLYVQGWKTDFTDECLGGQDNN